MNFRHKNRKVTANCPNASIESIKTGYAMVK